MATVQHVTRESAAARARPGFWKRSEHVLGPDWRVAWLFFAPTLILLFALVGWPFAQGLYLSFTKTIGSTVTLGPFVGLQNYIDLFQDSDFTSSLWITVQFTFWAELFKPILGIIAALLLHNVKRYRALLSAAILLPWIVPGVVQALIWRALYDPIFGGLNYILLQLHLTENGVAWLGDPKTALWAVILVNVWAGIPFFTITQLAGLKSIDPELYSAAAVDGANAWQRFRYITLPGIAYTQIVASLLSTVWTMNNFGTIYILTTGGPLNSTRVIGILTFERAFNAFNFGSGAAISLILLPIFGFVIWILAAYMMSGTRASDADSVPVQLRVVSPVVKPLGKLFTLLFDGGEAFFGLLGNGIRKVSGRSASEPAMGARAGKTILTSLSMAVLAILLLFELTPFYWVIVTSFKNDEQISKVYSPFWPQPWSLVQFNALLGTTDFTLWYRNTIQVAVIATAIGVLGSAAGAYALARLRWRGKGTMGSLMLITYMMPSVVMLIPIYQIMVWLHLINSLQALEVAYPSALLPFATWLLMGYYRSIPEELEDAARIDGANRLQIFWRLIIPLSKPALFAVMLFALTAAWNEFFLAYILIRSSSSFTLAIGLFQMIVGDIYPVGQMMVASLLMAIPVIVVYGFAQKYMVEGLTIGSVKG
ncbi:MAG TPA: ABC transporter permease subunit [Chloroflexota bacterium]|nr:ABC transporter permease subunit [Chloroflexota bacterium]